MKLLLDENLSRRLVLFLLKNYPDSTQVALWGMEKAGYREIWEYDRAHNFVIVTRDSDYYDLSTIYGQPPKVDLAAYRQPDQVGNAGGFAESPRRHRESSNR